MSTTDLPDPSGGPPDLRYSLRNFRTLFSGSLSLLTAAATLLACVPLFSVLWMLVYKGGRALSWRVFVELPPSAYQTAGGGFGNAILGTLVMVGLAALISVPFGVLAAVFLAVFGPDSKLANGVRFCAKTLTGMPSILAGVFAYAAIVLLTGTKSAVAGGIALSILMLPIVMLTAEEAMKMVPQKMKEAAFGMGCTQTQVVLKVILPTAFPGILTGVMLSVARAAGETAPLLFTAAFSNYWIVQNGQLQVTQETASMAVFIYNMASSFSTHQQEMAWVASLVLVVLVLVVNLTAQAFSKKQVKA